MHRLAPNLLGLLSPVILYGSSKMAEEQGVDIPLGFQTLSFLGSVSRLAL